MRLARLLVFGFVGGAAYADDVKHDAPPDEPTADIARATELYRTAEQEVVDARYDDALRDYSAALELTSDPVLYFKIGSANARLGRCDEAKRSFDLYLANAHPEQQWIDLSQQRIAACAPSGSATPTETGSSSTGSATTTSGSDALAGSGDVAAAIPSTPTGSAAPIEHVGHGRDGAWIAVAGTVALVTTGAILAFAASSSEQDVKDLYAGFDGTPPVFSSSTQQRYQDLLDEGHRYQYLAWASFGLAAAAAATATILFIRSPAADGEHHARVTPVIAPHVAGVAASVSF